MVTKFMNKSVWSPVIEQLDLEKEPVNPNDELAVAMIMDFLIVGRIPKNYPQITWYLLHEGALSSVILLGEGGKEGLEVPCKYIYCYGSTKDLAFIETWCLFVL